VLRPKRKSIISSKWLDKMKHEANGSIEKCKEEVCVDQHLGIKGDSHFHIEESIMWFEASSPNPVCLN